jgi:hypothetical protein
MTRIFVSLLVSSLCLSIAACGGYSAEEAKTKCDLERNANSACSTDTSYNQCLSCYESCGVRLCRRGVLPRSVYLLRVTTRFVEQNDSSCSSLSTPPIQTPSPTLAAL